MGVNYQVHLTATAEKDYEQIHADTLVGDVLVSVDKAIDEVLSMAPINPALSLAGCLSFVFMMSLGPVCIYYLAYAEQGLTYVLHIGATQQGADLSWLHEAVKNGEGTAE